MVVILLTYFLTVLFLPIHHWTDQHLDYYMKQKEYQLFYGKCGVDSSMGAWILKQDEWVYLPRTGGLIRVENNGEKLLFERITVEINNGKVQVYQKKKNKLPGQPLVPSRLIFAQEPNKIILNGERVRLSRSLKNKFKELEKWKLVYLDDQGAVFFKDNQLKFIVSKTNEVFQTKLPEKVDSVRSLWWEGDTVKILVETSGGILSFGNEPQLKLMTIIQHVFQSSTDTISYLDAWSGATFCEPEFTMNPSGILPINPDTTYMSLNDGIYRISREDDYVRFVKIKSATGSFTYLVPGEKDVLLLSYVDDKSQKTIELNISTKKFREREEAISRVFVDDSLIVYQIGNRIYWGKRVLSSNPYLDVTPDRTVIDVVNGLFVIRDKDKGVGVYHPVLVQNRYELSLVYYLADPEVGWVYQLNQVPVFIKKNWALICSDDPFLFKRPASGVFKKIRQIKWLRQGKSKLLVVSNNDQGCLLDITSGSTLDFHNEKILGANYRYGKFFIITTAGLYIF